LESRNQQVGFLRDFAKNECHQILTFDVIGHAFGIEPSDMQKIYSKPDKKPKPPNRPPAPDKDQTTGLPAFILNGIGSHSYVTQRDTLSFIELNYRKCLTYQCMASFLKLHELSICQSVVRCQENLRLEVSHEHLDRYIKLIQEYVPLVPTELLFNIDESGFSDWEEYKQKGTLIPMEWQATTLHYPRNRKIRHQTLMCCVTAAGDTYCPLLLSAQPVAREVFQHQVRDGINFQIQIAHPPDVASEIFKRYIDSVLIPAVKADQEPPG
jgi:hypothetical protein